MRQPVPAVAFTCHKIRYTAGLRKPLVHLEDFSRGIIVIEQSKQSGNAEYDIYFAKESGTWENMGVAFLDTEKAGTAKGVAYLNTLRAGLRENYPEMTSEEIESYLKKASTVQ